MSQLVFSEKGQLFTDSLVVAEKFAKEHKNVLRDIELQIEKLVEAEESEFSRLNFERSTYTNERKRKYPKFDMTEEGFAIVAMAYVTPEAMKMKVRFLEEFKRMREQLQFRMLDKEHQKEAMDRLKSGLTNPVRVNFIKANSIANKTISTMYGYPKAIKKCEMSPNMLVPRQEILDETVNLMALSAKFNLDLSISKAVQGKYLN
jgi:Rha family phage regulatory protein